MDRGGCPAHELARSVVIRLLSIADASSWSSLPLGRSLSAKTPSPGRQAVAAPRTVAASVFPGRAYACLESGWGCCSAVLLPNDVASLRAVASLPVAGFSFPYLFFSFIFDFFFYFFPLRRPATHEFNSRIRRRPPPPVFSSASQRPRAGGGFGAGSAHQANQALQASIGTSSTACASVAVVDCTLQSPLSCWSFWSCWSCESPFLSLSCALRTLSRDLHHHSAERCMLQWSVFA